MTLFACGECQTPHAKWTGRCIQCGKWNSVVEIEGRLTHKPGRATRLSDMEATADAARISTGVESLDVILGGGLAISSSVLIAGDPGAGKSTLMLDVASNLCMQSASVLYASSEETAESVASRAKRVGVHESLMLVSATDYDTLESEIAPFDFVVIDSLQMISVYADSPAGSLIQVREAASRLTSPTRKKRQTLLMVCHITKNRDFAGPKHLQHLVDTLLMFELDAKSDARKIYSFKNRFGATNKEAHFRMRDTGLIDLGVTNKE